MCGRFARIVSDATLREKYRLERMAQLQDRYNIAPMQNIAAVRTIEKGRELVLLQWGLIPGWSKDDKIAFKLTNARAETVAEKPSFRSAFKKRRCLIPASGYYEWQKQATGPKQPFYIFPHDGGLFSFAGLWESWHNPKGEEVQTCTILTTSANEVMKPIHERMPVILGPSAEEQWLDPRAYTEDLQLLLVPFAGEDMEAHRVSLLVNNPKHDGPKCIEPAVT
jgi:putative SOS response-associated peptidase YedK